MLGPFPFLALVRRELLVSLRKRRVFVMISLFVLACMALVAMNWPSDVNIRMLGTRISESLVEAIGLSLLVFAGLFMPGLASTAISSEHEQDTFDLLHCTLLRPRGMLLGKLTNSLGVFTLAIVAILPVGGAVFFLVGLSPTQVMQSLCMVYATAFACTGVGLYFSARCRRVLAAVILSYLFGSIAFGGPLIVLLMLGEFFRFTFVRDLLAFLFYNVQSPFWISFFQEVLPGDLFPRSQPLMTSLLEVFSPLGVVLGANQLNNTQFAFALSFQILIGLFFLARARKRLHRPPPPPTPKAEIVIDDEAVLETRRKRFPYYLIDPARRRAAIEDGRNPMFVREWRWGLLGKMSRLVRVFYALVISELVIFSASIVFFISAQFYYSVAVAMMLICGLTAAAAPALLCNALTKEREQGNLDMLRMTLVSDAQILWGKLGGAAVTATPFVVAGLISTVMVSLVASISWNEPQVTLVALQGCVTLVVVTFVALSLSLFASVLARRSGTAVVLSYAMALFAFVGFYLLGWLATQMFEEYVATAWSHNLLRVFRRSIWADLHSVLSPIASYMGCYAGRFRMDYRDLALWAASMASFTAAGAALLWVALGIFRRQLRGGAA